ncbi:MAG: sodium/proline symporter [Faecalibacterium sp.]|jgi:sodium/proline symporter|nr:sodium/proline symporter [Faecalibacterium sp.]
MSASSAILWIIAAIVVYLAAMLFIGYRCSKRNASTDDFYLGGRRLGPLVTAMSAEASDMSSWLLMGLPGVAYLSGVCDAFWTAVGLAVGTWLNWFFVARRLRRYSSNIGAVTVPDFFSKRWHDDKNLLNAIAAVVIIVFFVPYTASGFAACGKLFYSLFGVDYFTAMILSALVIVLYTTMGGFLAASTTDLVQSIVMTFALVVVLGYGIFSAGGIGAVLDNARSLPGYLSLHATYDAASGAANSYSPLTIVSTLAWGLGYFGMPHILLRFMAIHDEKKLVLSRRIATVWVVISMTVAVLIGVVGLAMTKAGTVGVLEGSASENIIVKIAALLSQHGVLAALMAGVILAGILAATMSTSDSQLLAAASGVSENILHEFFGIKLSQKASLLAARVTVVAISVLAIFIARDPDSSVFGIVSFAWAGFGGAFGAVMLCALFWKRSNRYGALAGMISGGAMVFLWKYLVRPLGGVWNIYELLPAFLTSLAFCVVVSLLTKAPEQAVVAEYDTAQI